MGIQARVRSLWHKFTGIPGSRSEGDIASDPAHAGTRAPGGEPDPSAPDQHSTTGTTPNDVFVGRASGTDIGYTGKTGAELRSEYEEERQRTDSPPDSRDDA